jgi:hypothetical protein
MTSPSDFVGHLSAEGNFYSRLTLTAVCSFKALYFFTVRQNLFYYNTKLFDFVKVIYNASFLVLNWPINTFCVLINMQNGPKESIRKAIKNKYELKIGTELIRIYNGTEHKVKVLGADKFEYPRAYIYHTLRRSQSYLRGQS